MLLRSCFFFAIIFLCGSKIFSQAKLPVYRANSIQVSVLDGNNFGENQWTISPTVRPDIYTTSNKKIVFYTDIDTISYEMEYYNDYDFYIILKGKDTAWTRIECIPTYKEKLKAGSGYNFSDKRFVPNFTYQSVNDAQLKKIRTALQLDSIAGTGNEISQMINLMHWVHNLIRHDGSSDNPTLKNAIDIIKICQSEKRGVNCRMMATVLNECYLAMGFKSRFVRCMPRELKFDECHVINMVYSNDLKKWIWMDPTFDAYVMDEKGTLLGIEEVRNRLINGGTLILNPDANWNRKSSQTKEGYLENYMTKNLYRLRCYADSRFNTETNGAWPNYSSIELLPLDGLNQKPQVEIEKNDKTKSTYTSYITNNPDLFWRTP